MKEFPGTLVIGAGPAGLSVAACLRAQGVEVDLVDRHGVAGGAYARMDPALELASPRRYNALPGCALPAGGEYATAREYRSYLEGYAMHHRLAIRRAAIASVRRDGPGFVTDEGSEPRRYAAVVVASGAFDHPNMPDVPGLAGGPHVTSAGAWRACDAAPGASILVIGAATTAVEIAEAAAAAGLRPNLSARGCRVHVGSRRWLGRDVHDFAVLVERWPVGWGARFCRGRQALPAGDRGFRALRRAGRVKVRPAVSSFDGRVALFADGTRDEFDAVVIAAGYRYATPFLPAEVERRAPNGALLCRKGESTSWPGLYAVGHACAHGLDSQFLRGIARDAPRVAKQIAARLAR